MWFFPMLGERDKSLSKIPVKNKDYKSFEVWFRHKESFWRVVLYNLKRKLISKSENVM